MSKIERYIQNSPKVYKAKVNPVLNAILEAWAAGDAECETQIANTKEQLFVRTSRGQWLDRLGSGLGVDRPASLGLLDEDYQELIPNLSLKAKTVRSIFYDTMDVFWGPLFSRANITTLNVAPFNVSPGDVFKVIIDGIEADEVTALPEDIANPGAATAEEIAAILNRIDGITASVIQDQLSGTDYVNVRTDTVGPRGAIQVVASTMVGGSKLDFNLDENTILSLEQRTVIYEIRQRELIIEIPAVVPTLRRTLRGSHHFHSDETLEAPVPPNNGVWQGSFFFETSGPAFTVTSNYCESQEILEEGNVYTKVTVDDASNIPNEPGFLVFNFGREGQEQPVPYIGRPNNNTILLDPSHVFQKTHLANSSINYIQQKLAYTPRIDGSDLAIYFTSPVDARRIVQGLLRKLKAAGVVIKFIILLPEYRYLVDNPYAEEDS